LLFRWSPFLTTDVWTLWLTVIRDEMGESTDGPDNLSGEEGGTGDSDDVDELELEVLL
jgi:hypothetical protein